MSDNLKRRLGSTVSNPRIKATSRVSATKGILKTPAFIFLNKVGRFSSENGRVPVSIA